MRKTLLLAILFFIVGGAASHFAALRALPGLIMDRATANLEARDLPVNAWEIAPRMRPETQTIVRASPDLAYSVCLLDVSGGPVKLTVPRSGTYGSLSVFQGNTENVFVGNLEGDGQLDVTVVMTGQDDAIPQGSQLVEMNSARGIALVRRLAPRQEAYDQAVTLTDASVCQALTVR